MSFISVAVGVKANRNIFLSLWKNQYQTSILLKNKLTSKFTTSTTSTMSSCIFCQIVNKTAEANILHEVKNFTNWYQRLFICEHFFLGWEVDGLYWPKTGRRPSLSCDTEGRENFIPPARRNARHGQEHIVDIRALKREDIPLVREMEEVGLKVLQDQTGQVGNVLTGFHWPIHSVGHLHMHIIAPADNMRLLNRIIFSGMFFGSTQSAIEMLEKK